MNELEEIEDTLHAYQHKRYPPMKSDRVLETWSPPALTPEQQAELDAYIKEHNLPF